MMNIKADSMQDNTGYLHLVGRFCEAQDVFPVCVHAHMGSRIVTFQSRNVWEFHPCAENMI